MLAHLKRRKKQTFYYFQHYTYVPKLTFVSLFSRFCLTFSSGRGCWKMSKRETCLHSSDLPQYPCWSIAWLGKWHPQIQSIDRRLKQLTARPEMIIEYCHHNYCIYVMSCLGDETLLSFEQNLYLYDEFVQHNFCCNNLKEQNLNEWGESFYLVHLINIHMCFLLCPGKKQHFQQQ